jgi:hypothetical protein
VPRYAPSEEKLSTAAEIDDDRLEHAMLDDNLVSDHGSEEDNNNGHNTPATTDDEAESEQSQDGRGPVEDRDPNWRIWDREGYAEP